MPNTSLQGLLDRFIDQFASAIADRAQERFNRAVGGRAGRPVAGGRPCPVPGCPNPGAGPRNRWFCREHARSLSKREQNRILAEAREKRAAANRTGRVSPARGRKLDMRCRVEGCKNRSRGPRFGYMCEEHSKKLSPKEQEAAREKYRATHSGKAA